MAVNILHSAVITGSLSVGSEIRDTTDQDTGFDFPGGNKVDIVCGNTTRASVTATAFNIEVAAIANNTLELNNGLIDIVQSQGADGQILSSKGAGNGVEWIDVSLPNFDIDGDLGSGPYTISGSNAQTFFIGGTGISTTASQPATGSGQITFNLTNTGVTANSYTSANITVDAQGRITAASNGSGGTGVSGSGTVGTIPVWETTTSNLGDSPIVVSTNDLDIPRYIRHIGATDDYFGFPTTGRFSIALGNSEKIRVVDSGVTVYDDLTVTGGLLTINDNAKYKTPTGTGTTYNGEIVDFGSIAGAVSAGDLVVLKNVLGNNPQWAQADYNSALNATGMLGIYDGTNVLVRGFVQNSSFSFTTSGAPIYMGVTGGISTSAPTASGDYVRIIGYVADAANDRIYFCPDNTWVLI